MSQYMRLQNPDITPAELVAWIESDISGETAKRLLNVKTPTTKPRLTRL